jgi:arylformamidase
MKEWIDITRTLTDGMIHWPGDPPFHWERYNDLNGPGTCNLSRISTGVHIGTHIDAPLHFIDNGMDIAEIPLVQLCGPAIVVDVDAARDVAIEDLQDAGIKPGERVLLRTVNQALWDKPEFDPSYYGISADAAMWLVDNRVPLVGVDYLSVDAYRLKEQPAHLALLGNGVVIIEGLDLSKVKPGRYEMVALPLKIAGSEAGPARVIIRKLRRRPMQLVRETMGVEEPT